MFIYTFWSVKKEVKTAYSVENDWKALGEEIIFTFNLWIYFLFVMNF